MIMKAWMNNNKRMNSFRLGVDKLFGGGASSLDYEFSKERIF